MVTAFFLIVVTVLFGCNLVRHNRQILRIERRVEALEQGRPVKIEDGPTRLTKNRQDR